MSLDEAGTEGTLKPDGTLELDQMPSLSPGRVKVILQSVPANGQRQLGLAEVIDEIRQSQQARGFQDRSAEEIEAAMQEGEQDYEKKMQTLRSQAKSSPWAGGSRPTFLTTQAQRGRAAAKKSLSTDFADYTD